METGDIVDILIEDMSRDGKGIGHAGGMAVFVDGAVYLDTVRAEITRVKKNYALARAAEIREPSPYRTEPDCPYHADCGGCLYRELTYEGQLELKAKQVRDKLVRIAGIKDPKVNDILGAENTSRYRNKAGIKTGTDGSVGFYGRKSRRTVDCEDCLIQRETAAAAAGALRRYLAEHGGGSDAPAGMTVRTAPGTGEVMVTLETRGRGIENAEDLISGIDNAIFDIPGNEQGELYSLESVWLETIREGGRSKFEHLAGKRAVSASFPGGMRFEISPESFYQVNAEQTEKLYAKAAEYAAGGKNILDIYCGVGTIGLYLAKNDPDVRVTGIESVKSAVIDANRNAVINGIVNAVFVCGKAEEVTESVLAGYTDKYGEEIPPFETDTIILDPPRAGCAPELIDTVLKAAPDRIVYVSCDPATLARDIKLLTARGEYEFIEATPVDMFPHTGHCENVCILEKR